LNAGWRYRPSFVVGFDSFFDSAFIGIGGGFCFGNYYDPFYARAGYRPWYQGRGRYDPVFAYHGWQNHRNNPNWVAVAQNVYVARSAGRAAVPPATFAQQNALVSAKTGRPVVTPLEKFSGGSMRLVKPSQAQVQVQQAATQQTRAIAANRQRVETANAAATPRGSQVRTVPLATLIDSKTGSGGTKNIQTPTPLPKTTNPLPTAPIVVNPLPRTTTPLPTTPRVINPQPKIINTLPKGPSVTNTLPKGPSVTNSLPKGPSVTNTLPKSTLPPVGVTNKTSPAPRIIQTPPPAPRITAPAPRITTPAPRITTPAPRITTPAPRVTAPAPRITAPAPRVTAPPRSTPPRPAPSVGRRK
jgi:hypothetical protein